MRRRGAAGWVKSSDQVCRQDAGRGEPTPKAAHPRPRTDEDRARQLRVELLLVVDDVHKAVAQPKLDVKVGEVGGDGAAQALRDVGGGGRAGMGLKACTSLG